MKNARNLKGCRDGILGSIGIAPDLTHREREIDRKLRDELRTKREKGEQGWYIKGGKLQQNKNF